MARRTMQEASEAARTLRDPEASDEEKREAGSVLGHSQGRTRGESSRGRRSPEGEREGSMPDKEELSEAARIMRTSQSEEERSEAARTLGQAGGRSRGEGSHRGRARSREREIPDEEEASEAARTLRNPEASEEEKSRAASVLGRR